MRLFLSCTLFLFSLLNATAEAFVVVHTKQDIFRHCGQEGLILIASTGRSGSTMLTTQIEKYIPKENVLKAHILPPSRDCFKGKILFIFSNPDEAAESVLFKMLHQDYFGEEHFVHVETADRKWLKKIGGPYQQTLEENLLSYDALGIYTHLKVWLHTQVKPCRMEKAHILAIKYENLWDQETVEAIQKFLKLPRFKLPPQMERGHEDLFEEEIAFRQAYNLGTADKPRYAAYDKARALWEKAPAFQFLRIRQ